MEPTEEGIKAMQLPSKCPIMAALSYWKHFIATAFSALFEGDIVGIPVDNGQLQFDSGDIFRYPVGFGSSSSESFHTLFATFSNTAP